MYDAVSQRVAGVTVLPWLPVGPRPHGDLGSYARRYVREGLVRPGDLLGGSSFGGMLAQEIARLIPVSCLLLMGTCRSGAGIAPCLRRLGRFAPVLPIPRRPAALIAWPLAFEFGATGLAHRRLLQQWITETDAEHLRWAAQAAVGWKGAGRLTAEVFQIHGSRDRVLPPAASGADLFVAGAGHLLVVTHPDAVARWLLDALTLVDWMPCPHAPV